MGRESVNGKEPTRVDAFPCFPCLIDWQNPLFVQFLSKFLHLIFSFSLPLSLTPSHYCLFSLPLTLTLTLIVTLWVGGWKKCRGGKRGGGSGVWTGEDSGEGASLLCDFQCDKLVKGLKAHQALLAHYLRVVGD